MNLYFHSRGYIARSGIAGSNSKKRGFSGGTSGKEPTCQCRRHRKQGFSPWVGKIPWRRVWQPTPVSLLGESHGQKALMGYNPWGQKNLATKSPPR